MTKHCGRCDTVKPVEEFHRSSKGDGFQRWCKECRKAYDAAYSRRTLDRRRARWHERKPDFMRWYTSLKEDNPCVDCGAFLPAAVMQFDHMPEFDKRANVGDLARSMRKRRVAEEVAKCELVCANCHAIRTVARRATGRGAIW